MRKQKQRALIASVLYDQKHIAGFEYQCLLKFKGDRHIRGARYNFTLEAETVYIPFKFRWLNLTIGRLGKFFKRRRFNTIVTIFDSHHNNGFNYTFRVRENDGYDEIRKEVVFGIQDMEKRNKS